MKAKSRILFSVDSSKVSDCHTGVCLIKKRHHRNTLKKMKRIFWLLKISLETEDVIIMDLALMYSWFPATKCSLFLQYNLRARFMRQVLGAMTSLDWSGDVTPSMHFRQWCLFNTCIRRTVLWRRLSDSLPHFGWSVCIDMLRYIQCSAVLLQVTK